MARPTVRAAIVLGFLVVSGCRRDEKSTSVDAAYAAPAGARELPPFTRLRSTSAAKLDITKGKAPSIRIVCGEDEAKRISAKVVGDELVIDEKGGSPSSCASCEVFVTCDHLTAIRSQGGIQMHGNGSSSVTSIVTPGVQIQQTGKEPNAAPE